MSRVGGEAGERVIAADVAGTCLFVVTAVLAATLFTTALQWVGAITALVLFAVGVFCFLWSYVHALQRSRTDDISVTALYLLTGPATPGRVKRVMLGSLVVQTITATATTFARLEGPDGNPGSSLAVGFLVPMFGIGLNGLWSSRHGEFGPRQSGASATEIRQNGDMAETATEYISIAAPPERVWDIAADVERYPEWARDIKDVVVRSRDEEQRPKEVEFRASALGRSTHYTLSYDYSEAPEALSWKMVKGDIERAIDGAYHFRPDGEGGTYVQYDLAIELATPLPGFVKRRAEVRILNTIRELKARAEA